MIADVILFLRTENTYIFNNYNSTGNYVYGHLGLIRPRLSLLNRYCSINKEDYDKKLKEGRSLTPESMYEFFGRVVDKMGEIFRGYSIDDEDIIKSKAYKFQKRLLPGMISFPNLNSFFVIHFVAVLLSLACDVVQRRREVFENLTINNVIYFENVNCYKVKIDFHEKSQRPTKVDLMFPESMTEFIHFWIDIRMNHFFI